ncbi:MAG: zinc-binding dehydrogenase [Nitrospira sp.]|nr:zinc-binding dehydrogenase [Nitrospira sp.]
MLANILVKPGTIELREIPTPTPSDGEILVKIKAALTCGTDVKAFRRGHPMIPMPGVFGHEFSGIVTGIGKGVKGFKEGDEIMAVHSAPCLTCRYCKKKLYNLCENIMSTKVLGAFAEYILLPSHIVRQNVFHKSKNLSFEEAAFLEPLSCVVHSMESLDIKKDDHTLVIGAGPIGLLHLLLLKETGARVTVNDKHNKKLKMAKNLGADFIFKPEIVPSPSPSPLPSREGEDIVRLSSPSMGTEDAFKKIPSPLMVMGNAFKKIKIPPYPPLEKIPYCPPLEKGGWGDLLSIGFDYVFECTGRPEVWEKSVNYLRRGGTVILFGGCKSGTTVTYDTGRIHYDEITIKGVFHYTPADVKKAYKLLSDGKLKVSSLISGRYPLKNIQKAFDKLIKGEGIKYAIIP